MTNQPTETMELPWIKRHALCDEDRASVGAWALEHFKADLEGRAALSLTIDGDLLRKIVFEIAMLTTERDTARARLDAVQHDSNIALEQHRRANELASSALVALTERVEELESVKQCASCAFAELGGQG
jgi:hypothetical protein